MRSFRLNTKKLVTPKSSIAEEAECASEDLGSLVCFDSVTPEDHHVFFMVGISSVCVCVCLGLEKNTVEKSN